MNDLINEKIKFIYCMEYNMNILYFYNVIV